MHRDFGRRPAGQAFQFMFHRPVLADVQELAAAGETWTGGSNVWLRFHASPKTLQDLKAVAKRDEPWKKDPDSIRDEPSNLIRFDIPNRLDWHRVWKLRNAEYYVLGEGPGSTQFVIDRDTGTVNAFYWNI